MKHTAYLLGLLMAFSACEKEKIRNPPPSHPQMNYVELGDASVSFNQSKGVDLNGDGQRDLIFYTLLVGDPVLVQDKQQYYASSGVKRNLLGNAESQSPILNRHDTIGRQHPGFNWWELSNILLAEKIITYTESWWRGNWKNANHQFLPVQVEEQGQLYHGWVELSFSTADAKLTLHRAALSKEPAKTVKAGW